MNNTDISRATLGRLPVYLEYLKSTPSSVENISAPSIAKQLNLGEVQVRKDLSAVCGLGKPRVGYRKSDLITAIERYIGCTTPQSVIVVGAGKLGKAILEHDGFSDYGLEITAAFDVDPKTFRAGKSGKDIYALSELQSYCARQGVAIAILTVPPSQCQSACDAIVAAGIKRILNFSQVKPRVPSGVIVEQVNLALALAHLKYA